MTTSTEYDPRFLRGVVHFNRRDFFEAHEVWEDLWHEMAGPERRFVQGLIQAAVCVYHALNGNARGARRLFVSGRRYMTGFPHRHLGMDAVDFWLKMEHALRNFFVDPKAIKAELRPEWIPTIALTPEPNDWPEVS